MRIRTLLLAIALVAALVGCGGDSDSDSDTTTTTGAPGPDLSAVTFTDLTGQTAVQVDARDNVFKEQHIQISVGTTVTFKAAGRNQHNVLPVEDGAFPAIEADDFEPGTEVDLKFEEAGDYPYYCSLHGTTTKGMIGAIRVVE